MVSWSWLFLQHLHCIQLQPTLPMKCYMEVDIVMVNKGISYHPWLLDNTRKEDGDFRSCW